jgi:hypothetical protein
MTDDAIALSNRDKIVQFLIQRGRGQKDPLMDLVQRH